MWSYETWRTISTSITNTSNCGSHIQALLILKVIRIITCSTSARTSNNHGYATKRATDVTARHENVKQTIQSIILSE